MLVSKQSDTLITIDRSARLYCTRCRLSLPNGDESSGTSRRSGFDTQFRELTRPELQ